MKKTLVDQRAQAVNEARQILDRADKQKRGLTSEEEAHYARIDADIDRLNAAIEKEQRQAAALLGRPNPPSASSGEPASFERPGFAVGSMLRGRNPRSWTLSPNSDEFRRAQPQYRDTFLGYLVNGRSKLGMMVGKDSQGGYLAPMQYVNKLITFLDDNVFMRQICEVSPPMPTAVNIGVPTWDTDPGDADWTAEVPASEIAEDTAARTGLREMMPHLMTKLVKASLKMLRSGVINAEDYLVQRIGYKCAVTEEKAFLTGDGNKKALGVFTANDAGIPTSRDVRMSGATTFTADDIIDSFHGTSSSTGLKESYQRNASLVAHRSFFGRCRKLKDGNGQYLWQPGLGGMPNTILDRPCFSSEFAPSTFTASQYIAVWGDFKAGYQIVDSLAMEIQRLAELFALTNQVGLLARKETDGAPVLPEAFSRLQMKAS